MERTTEQYNDAVLKGRNWFQHNAIMFWALWQLNKSKIFTEILLKTCSDISDREKQKRHEDYELQYIIFLSYAVASIIKMTANIPERDAPDEDFIVGLFEKEIAICKDFLLSNKKHYDDAWRLAPIQSITRSIMKVILEIKDLENTIRAPENRLIDAYRDIVNYCIFALIRIDEARNA